jgi:hypothetical protein
MFTADEFNFKFFLRSIDCVCPAAKYVRVPVLVTAHCRRLNEISKVTSNMYPIYLGTCTARLYSTVHVRMFECLFASLRVGKSENGGTS